MIKIIKESSENKLREGRYDYVDGYENVRSYRPDIETLEIVSQPRRQGDKGIGGYIVYMSHDGGKDKTAMFTYNDFGALDCEFSNEDSLGELFRSYLRRLGEK